MKWLDRLRASSAAGTIRSRHAEAQLRDLLRDRALDVKARPMAEPVWIVFKEFAEQRSDATGPEADGILYQSGVFDFSGRDEFYLDLVRQFEIVDSAGEHQRYEQLHCEFRFELTEELRAFERFSRWWFWDSHEPWMSFVQEIERRP